MLPCLKDEAQTTGKTMSPEGRRIESKDRRKKRVLRRMICYRAHLIIRMSKILKLQLPQAPEMPSG